MMRFLGGMLVVVVVSVMLVLYNATAHTNEIVTIPLFFSVLLFVSSLWMPWEQIKAAWKNGPLDTIGGALMALAGAFGAALSVSMVTIPVVWLVEGMSNLARIQGLCLVGLALFVVSGFLLWLSRLLLRTRA